MTILAIDTSTNHGGVALLVDGALRLDETFVADRSTSSSLFAVLERAVALVPRLDQVAIGLGPGSYAGVRIAIAAALGLELGLGARLIGLPSVAALETDAPAWLAIGDARRDTFYFTRVEDGGCVEGPLLVSESEVRARIAAHESLPVFASVALPAFPAAQIALPSAGRLARLAQMGRGITATGELEPIYLREPHITQPKARSAGG
ncbi:MAG: tRNA (adenosine(37)-N6)-threonylcarbamoyltransferase complex dimerization subunit type 1 TsaB [Chthoniobacter sp.]|nr:tRNA (adenosine(37)-N6)-threonylcarbamoyltransferase complex dimerization subunit type 1 TsaB [Chthoniobacter sp.]